MQQTYALPGAPPRGRTSTALALGFVGFALAAASGVAIAWSPWYSGIFVVFLVMVGVLWVCTAGMPIWGRAAAGLLTGFIVLGRGFAYTQLNVGDLPIYIGEIGLAICLATMPHRQVLPEFLRERPAAWLIGWMGVGLALTVPQVGEYGVAALRDAAIWYYGAFAYVGYGLASRPEALRRFLRVLGVAFVAHFLFCVVWLSGLIELARVSPPAPGSNFPLFHPRPDASAVHLGAGFLFALFMGKYFGWAPWTRWVVAFPQLLLVIALQVRAGWVAFAAASAYLALRFRARQVALAAIALVCIGLTAMVFELQTRSGKLVLAVPRLVEEFETLLPIWGAADYEYSGSRRSVAAVDWRREYWTWVVTRNSASVSSMLLGIGFGPDLTPQTDSIKFSRHRNRPNRNPHNIAVTVFGRMGVIGLGLWIAFHVAFFALQWRWLTAAKRVADGWQADLAVFLMAYVILMLGAALFGVLLESPFMAAPYFFIVGLSLRRASAYLRRPAGQGGNPPTPVPA
jgi:hypothetical protein